VAEIGLGIFIIGALLVIDRDRLAWVTEKVRDWIEWFSS
jgi:hypothetical protein